MPAEKKTSATSWFTRIVLGLVIVAMAGFGLTQYSVDAIRGDEVIKAGSRSIDSAEFRREYDRYKKRAEQQAGQPITTEMAEQNNLDSTVLNGLATREAFSELLHKIGIRPSDSLILAQISKIPDFFNPITGAFDDKTFTARLTENGYTKPGFDRVLGDEMASQHWAVAIQNGFNVPRAYGALGSVFALEARDLAYFVVTPQSVPQPAAPSDAQLLAFIKESKGDLMVPEMRVFTVVPFVPGAAAAAVANAPIDAAELQKRFNFRKDTLSKPETRTLVQIPVKDQASAQKVTARLTSGEAPAAVARSLGVDAVTYEDKPLTAVADRKIGEAAFRLASGQIATLQGDLGLAVVRVANVSPGREVTLEEARPMLEAEIRKDMVSEKVYAQTQAYDDAHQGGASLPDAAKKAGVPFETVGPISAQGIDDKRRQMQGLPAKILETAFSLPAGGESEITELGEGAYFAVRVEKVIAPYVQPLNEIRPVVTNAWMRREITRAMEARTETLVARVRKGESLEAVAASAGYAVQRAPGLSRQTAEPRVADIGREILARAFAAKPREAWSTPTPTGFAIGRIDNVRMDTGPTAARMAEMNRGELAQAVFGEMAESAQVYARTKLKVRTDPARARAAAGFEPKEEPAAKAPEKKG
jgi:peptidyl-prolyl cis-trans isomerase D